MSKYLEKVSVVMPVYNVEQYVAEAIESVLNQTWEGLELIIVNDCSPDNSLQVCQRFTDPRIKIVEHEKNKGLAAARNTGIRHATGELVAFIDSDDLWYPEKLQLHIEHLDNNPHIGVSFSRSEFIHADGSKTGYHQMPKLFDITAREILCRNPVGNGSAPVIRKQVLEDIGYDRQGEIQYFDEDLRQSEDIECWIRIALTTAWKVEGIPQALTLYRFNEGGLSASLYKQYESWNRVIDKTTGYAPEFVADSVNRARAYQLRYLSRQAIRLRDGKTAMRFLHDALMTDPAILIEETARTMATLSAAYLMTALPKKLYLLLEKIGSDLVSQLQKMRISRDLQSAV